ncbi:hypothetical protein PAHAL_2G097900 [Panicum hallii]|uniref:F-box/LRR-repeat protein 15/At3g58940/PEG3-like LRR domain-containing protein n=1 Tax=Panicum hallii TaxID=206008 RepID=A0A2S3GXB8_9POAL|nr:hypothetical protein PAHAL_2G097900 [Panicum hallii]
MVEEEVRCVNGRPVAQIKGEEAVVHLNKEEKEAEPLHVGRWRSNPTRHGGGGVGILSPLPANAPDPNPPGAEGNQSHRQEPHPRASGGGGGDGVDHISHLPSAILGKVISLLPTKDAASTQTLASRGESFTDIVSHILFAHGGPSCRFCIPAQQLLDHPTTMDVWLYQCHLSDDTTQTIRFPQLKKLALQQVNISEDSMHSLIAGCTVLECLMLNKSFVFRCVRINCTSLTSIGLSVERNGTVSIVKLIIQDAPCLERFLYFAPCLERFLYFQPLMGLQVSVIAAPKLEALGSLCELDVSSRLALGSVIIQPCFPRGLLAINWTTPVCTVKNLAIDIFTLSLDIKHHYLFRCLDIRLKTILLNNYQGIKSQVNFAMFFVLNAKMLESMRFQGGCYNGSKRFLVDEHRLLQLEKRASRDSRFYFASKRCHHGFMHVNHAHDLSMSPFECVETRVGVYASIE